MREAAETSRLEMAGFWLAAMEALVAVEAVETERGTAEVHIVEVEWGGETAEETDGEEETEEEKGTEWETEEEKGTEEAVDWVSRSAWLLDRPLASTLVSPTEIARSVSPCTPPAPFTPFTPFTPITS